MRTKLAPTPIHSSPLDPGTREDARPPARCPHPHARHCYRLASPPPTLAIARPHADDDATRRAPTRRSSHLDRSDSVTHRNAAEIPCKVARPEEQGAPLARRARINRRTRIAGRAQRERQETGCAGPCAAAHEAVQAGHRGAARDQEVPENDGFVAFEAAVPETGECLVGSGGSVRSRGVPVMVVE